MPRITTPAQRLLDDFFLNWVYRHKVVATAEGGLEFEKARNAWATVEAELSALEKFADYHKVKADKWLTAYQAERVKNVGDFARKFVVRKRLQKIVIFLMRL